MQVHVRRIAIEVPPQCIHITRRRRRMNARIDETGCRREECGCLEAPRTRLVIQVRQACEVDESICGVQS